MAYFLCWISSSYWLAPSRIWPDLPSSRPSVLIYKSLRGFWVLSIIYSIWTSWIFSVNSIWLSWIISIVYSIWLAWIFSIVDKIRLSWVFSIIYCIWLPWIISVNSGVRLPLNLSIIYKILFWVFSYRVLLLVLIFPIYLCIFFCILRTRHPITTSITSSSGLVFLFPFILYFFILIMLFWPILRNFSLLFSFFICFFSLLIYNPFFLLLYFFQTSPLLYMFLIVFQWDIFLARRTHLSPICAHFIMVIIFIIWN
mmetsp:Transcript_27429/g.27056  ORF Transcript_27429/g.27056 Transcript_27429/m.27056 type:complete len:255 (-) Transcript_27429:257-1021(-)